MNLFKGRMVIELSTLVDTNNEEIMTEQAHDGLTSELFNEIMILLGAKGYFVGSIGATLEDSGKAKDEDFILIKSNTDKALRDIHQVYNKANRQIFKIE
ncbi:MULTISPECIES: hypothetical protein [Bacillus]|nr:hypothetical protein [Bacillus smithii]